MHVIRIAEKDGTRPLDLQPGGLAGVAGAVMAPAPGGPAAGSLAARAAGWVEEVIDVQAAGVNAGIVDGVVHTLAHALALARAEAARPRPGLPGGSPLYLFVQVTAESSLLRAKIHDGWVELPGGVDRREGGSQVVRLHMLRAREWEFAGLEEFTGVGSGVAANQKNGPTRWWVDATSLGVTPATPVRYSYQLRGLTSSTRPLTLFVGLLRDAPQGLEPFYRGAEGAALAPCTAAQVSDGGAVAGSYTSLSWTAAGGWELARAWRKEIDGLEAAAYQGKAYRVFLRLQAGPAERTLCRVDLSAPDWSGADQVLWESDPFYLEPGCELAEGPALFLPPWEVAKNAGAGRPVRVNLSFGTAGAGAKTIRLDFLALLPLDGWRTYRTLTGAPGVDVVDDAQAGVACSSAGHVTHTVEGPGFWLAPNAINRFYHLLRAEAEPGQPTTAAIDWSGDVVISIREQREQI